MNVPQTGITTSRTYIHVGKIEIHCRYINICVLNYKAILLNETGIYPWFLDFQKVYFERSD